MLRHHFPRGNRGLRLPHVSSSVIHRLKKYTAPACLSGKRELTPTPRPFHMPSASLKAAPMAMVMAYIHHSATPPFAKRQEAPAFLLLPVRPQLETTTMQYQTLNNGSTTSMPSRFFLPYEIHIHILVT